MTDQSTSYARLAEGVPPAPVNKRMALVVIAISQLMVVLDATIVNVALKDIRDALGFRSDSDLSWVVTGYTLTFGGFLLLGGKLADRLGRRSVFIGGAVLFALASLAGGLAESQEALIVARLVQGLGGALMSPSALSLLTVVFEEGPERNRALGVFSAITAGGAALGLILGGLLTDYLSWEWVFYVNIPVAALAIVGAVKYLPESRDESATGFDVPGAVLVTGGLTALVYGLVKLNDDTVGSGTKAAVFVLAAVLLAGFVLVQRTSRTPLLPFRLFRSRTLLGADLGALLIGAGIFAMFFFVTLWMQVVNGYSPTKAGLAFLPMTLLIGVGAGLSANLLGRVGPRPLLVTGTGLAAVGMLLLGLRLEPDSRYVTVVLPSLVLVAIGMGLAFVALTSAAVAGVDKADAGIASALLNAGQQVGGALGLAILTAVSTARSESVFPGIGPAQEQLTAEGGPAGPPPPEVLAVIDQVFDALVAGWASGFLVGAAFLAGAGVLTGLLVRVSKERAVEALKDPSAVAGA